jgi:hypothetical protein
MLLMVHLRYLVAHPHLAAPELTAEATAHLRRDIRLYALLPLASIVVSFHSPRVGMYLYLLLAIPTFSASRFDRLSRPAAVCRPDPPADDQ